MTVSQYDHFVPYTDLSDRGYFGVNAALVFICAACGCNNLAMSSNKIGLAGPWKWRLENINYCCFYHVTPPGN